MSVAYQVDTVTGGSTGPTNNQEQFVSMAGFLDYCATNGLCTRIAYNADTGADNGINFHDEGNPAGENSWGYWEWDNPSDVSYPTFGILLQYSDTEAFGSAPGNPAQGKGQTGVDGLFIAMALREDGSSPWGGTTGNDGQDTKGATVFTDGGSTVHVFPRSNNAGGSHSTNRENMMFLEDDGSGDCLWHVYADNDSIVWAMSIGNNGLYQLAFMGRYDKHPELDAAIDYPYCMVHDESEGLWGGGSAAVYGSTSGNSADEGGILAEAADGVVGAAVGYPMGILHAGFHPNGLVNPSVFDCMAIWLHTQEFTTALGKSFAGTVPKEQMGFAYNSTNGQLNGDASQIHLGIATQAAIKAVCRWDGGAAPSGSGRTGRRSFVA